MVGPFIFWDQMGPGEFLTGQGVDVRPHPHIGLSTVTYLFDGSMDHKDSLGNDMRIVPGDVNLMTAGKGIVHSERTGQDIRKSPSRLFGIQSWIAQPKSHENRDPAFSHAQAEQLPVYKEAGIQGRIILGSFEGVSSPVQTDWETFYLDVRMQAGSALKIPSDVEERALYVVKGQIEIAGQAYEPQQMLVLNPGDEITVRAVSDLHLMLLGGATMDGDRYIWWNFVASDKDQIRQAAEDWKNSKFAKVPGDEEEFIPLPDEGLPPYMKDK